MENKFEEMSIAQLKETAKEYGIKGVSTMKKAELVELLVNVENKMSQLRQSNVKKVEKEHSKENVEQNKDSSLDSGETKNGILEVLTEGYGFIRCDNYLPGTDDVYVSPAQIKRFNLKTGDIICGNTKVKMPKEH